MNCIVDQPSPSPAAPAADAAAPTATASSAPRSSTSNIPHPTSDIPQNPEPAPRSHYTTDEQFAVALNIARMEALDTLLAAAAIRDDRGNPTREAIFAANRVLAFTMHHDRLAARVAGAGPAAPNLPQGGGGREATGGGSGIPTVSPSSPSLSPSSCAPRIDIQLDIRPHTPRPSTTPEAASPNLPQGGDGGGAAGGGSGIPTAPSASTESLSAAPPVPPSELPTPPSSPAPHPELDTPDFPDDPNDFLELFDSFDDPAEAIASGLNGLMSPEDIVAALSRIAINKLAPPPDNRAPP